MIPPVNPFGFNSGSRSSMRFGERSVMCRLSTLNSESESYIHKPTSTNHNGCRA
jgi:hypothetical protein